MPILASNFTSNSLQGTVTVAGGQANIQLPLAAFAFEGQKTFTVKLRKEGFTGTVIGTSNVVTIPDTTSVVSLTGNLAISGNSYVLREANAITYTLVTANVPNGTNLYYSTLNTSANIYSNDFIGSNVGIITVNNNTATITIATAQDLLDELDESFVIQLRTGSTGGNVVYTANSNVYIQDRQPTNLSVTGGTQSNTTVGSLKYRIHTFTTTANLTINALSDTNIYNQIEIMAIGGGGGGASYGGGAGAGGMLYGFANIFTVGNTIITVGAGGASNNQSPGNDGDNTTLQLAAGGTITAYGGKHGGSPQGPPGRFGCGGGGNGFTSSSPNPAAIDYWLQGGQPSQSGLTGYASDGKSGQFPISNRAGGGGGTGGGPSPSPGLGGSNNGNPGYDGRPLNKSGSNVYYGGGGASHALGSQSPFDYYPGVGGLGGGGPSAPYGSGPNPAYNGGTNLGGGAGAVHLGAWPGTPGNKNSQAGGSGVVIIRYLYN